MTKIARPSSFDTPASEWLVWGDAMQEANDVRGELVGLSHGVDEGRTLAGIRDAYVKRYATQLLGQAANHLTHYTLHWKFSELSAVEVRIGPDDDGPALIRAILEAPVAELLHDITLIGVPDGARSLDLSASMDLLANVHRITSLGLVDDRARNARMLVSRDFDPDNNLVTLGQLAPFWDRLQHLRLEVADSQEIDLESIEAPELRSFTLRSLRFADWEDAQTMCKRLANASWPQLEAFELRLVETWVANVPNEIDPYVAIYSAPDYEGRDDTDDGDGEGINWKTELAPVLATLKACPLRRLALTSFDSSTSVLEAIVDSGLLSVIEELDLSDSALQPHDVDWMLEHRDVFAHLRRLVVERTSIGATGAATLREINPRTVYSEGNGAQYRYVVGQE